MARKSLLEEIREREAKPADTSGGITQFSQSSSSNNGRRKSLLEEIRDTTGGEGLNKKYVDRALKNGGGFGAGSGGIEYGDDGEVYLTHDYANESRLLSEIRKSGTKPYTAQGSVYKQEDMSPFQMAIDRILGVDRTQVTGGKTDWGKLLKGAFEQGANKANSRAWIGLNFLAGGFAQELRTLGETTYNDIVDALNMIPGVDLDYIGGTTNAITALKNQAVAANAAVEKKYTANANTSRAAQIVNILGSETVAAIPAALEAIFLAPAAAAGTGATTLGLDYASSLAKSGGLSGVSTMAAEGFRKLTSNPQFWTSYLDVVGDSYEGALEDGMSQDDATVFALVNSFINAVIEIGGVDEALGGIQNLPYKQAKAAQNNGKKAVVEWFKDAVLGEGKEEVFQGAFERGLEKVSGNNVPWFSSDMKDTAAVINPWTAAQEFTGGAVVGALLGGGQVGIDRAVNGAVDIYNDRSEQQAYKEAYGSGAQELINESQELNPGNKLAKKAQSRLDSGKSISGRDIRDIVRQNEAAIRTLEENRQEQDQPQTGTESAAKSSLQDSETSRETEQAFIRQVIEETGASDEAARVLEDGYIPEVNDAQSYAYGVREAFKLGEMGLDYQQAVENAQFFDSLEEQQFKHAFDLGAMKGGQVKEKTAAQREERKYYDSIEEFSAEFSSPDKVTEIFNEKPDADISEFADGFRMAYDMGKSGVSKRTMLKSDITALTEKQRTAAYNMGAADSDAEAAALSAKNKASAKNAGKKWNAGPVKYDGEYKGKGTVKGIGVNMKDVVQTLGINDVQKSAYRVCAKIAEATGINIVFYKSEAEADGRFRATQGEFSRSDPGTIYIDLNAGLGTIKDVSDLGKYTLLHTFSHEFTHFIEKWNPAQYNELRKTVFAEMEKNGKDVDALIRSKKGEGMSYDAASREAVAESLTEILPQAGFAETLYNEHRSLYEQIADKLKEFVEDIKAYFSTVRHDARNAYSSALMQELDGALKYSENVLSIFNEAARGAVENYQLTLDSGNTAESKSKAAKRVGMDFFRTEEYVAANESAPVLRDMIQSKSTADNDSSGTLTSDNGFTVSRNPEYNSVEVSFAEKPSEAVRDVLKANKFRWNGKKRVWYGKTEESTIAEALNKVYEAEKVQETADKTPAAATLTPEGEKLRSMLSAGKRAVVNGFEYTLTDGGAAWYASIERAENAGVYPVENSRNRIYSGSFATREEAVNELAVIAENNRLLIPEKTAEADKIQEVNSDGANEDNGKAVLEPEPAGNGASRLLDEVQAGDVQGAGGEREAVADAQKRAGQDKRDSEGQPVSTRDSGGDGAGQSGDIRRNDELTHARDEALKETVKVQIEQKSSDTPKGSNFVIGESLSLPAGEKARFKANVDAIKLIKQLEDEGRFATSAEQEILSKYVGWGGLSNAFGELKWNSAARKSEMTAKSGWEKEFGELRGLIEDGYITEDEYKSMSASTKNAHYTSVEVIKAMYDGLEKLGFKGGRMLEPSAGVGNFIGAMPEGMSAKVRSWSGIELDRVTGLIAKYLYPNADIRIEGFEKANLPDNYMDVAIGNVPFGNYGVVDRAYPKRITKAIHNYFFAKALDKVRPGGIVMFITSSFTMNSEDNSVRQYIMKRADLLGAIRLPNTAFAGNAGTQVVTDILILKKREAGTEYAGEAFLDAPYTVIEGSWNGANINEYFKNHPEMALGTPAFTRGMYGANSLTYNPLTDKGSLGEQIRKAFDKISGKMDYKEQQAPEKANFAAERAAKKPKRGSLEVGSDGKVYRDENGSKVEVSADKDTAERVSGLLGIRDAYRELINAQQQGLDSKATEKARKELNRVYDAFVKKYGYINDAKNAKAFENDPDSFSLLSLENYKKPVKANKAKGIKAQSASAVKADIFTKNTITPNRTITHVESIPEGVIVSVNRTGGIDAAYIAQLTGKSAEAVTRELIDSRMAFKTKDGGLEAPETYLSGNVRAKLREAEALVPLDKDFANNVEELKRVVPEDVPFEDIYVAVGTPWIPNSVYADFIADTLGGSNIESYYRKPDVTVGRTNTGEFKIFINNKRLKTSFRNTQEFGTSRRTFLDLVEAMMMSRSITVKDVIEDTDGRKSSVVNTVETAAAQAKAEEIAKRFQEWLWQDETRRSALTSLYNETFNALATPKYNGENLTVNGLNAEFSLRRHQADAVQRIVASGGNTLLAHKVGAGKTLEMAAAAMKLRELGIVKKPVFVVPKALTAQWGGEFKSYFPAARLLVADETSFTPANRRTFANRISNGDFDAVILSYEQFEKIPMSAEFQQRFYQQQIDEVIDAIAEEKAESGGKALTVKEMEKKKAQLEKKLAELTSKPKDTDNIEFEQLGIDSLFVDEAHNFKNLQYITRMNNVSGLGNSSGSQRAFDLFTKIRYLQGLNGGRGVVFATATPVMNSMAEMYIMQKYLQSDMLDRLGLKTFDAWAKQFGEVVNSVEIKPSGQGFRVKQSFSNFRNLNELQLLFRSFSDVLTDVPGLKIPKMKGGKVQVVECEPGQFQQEYMKELEKRADNVKNVDPKEDNMLKITSDGRKVSYTQRMIDPSLPYEPGSKIFRCCENVVKEYRESSAIKGTQIVFCDMATPKGSAKTAASANANAEETLDTESARLYDDMKAELVKQGIPANEIAFIHEADTDAKKKQLFDDVNEGRVRVLIGSTGKMGVGMNAQKRIVAIHHLDAPWRPGDVEQRDGRAFRQGNINDEVTKYVYVTTGSFDARLWDILDRKQHFIEQIMNGENIGRSAEDTGNVTLSAAEVKALASGNPLIEEQVRLDSELAKLRNERKAYNAALMRAKTKLLEDEQKIASLKSSIAKAKEDVKTRVDTYSENRYSMTVGKKTYTDKKEAGAALALEIIAKAKTGEFVTVGKFAGFEIRVIKQGSEYVGHITGAQSYKFNVYLEKTTYMATHIASVVEGIDGRIETWNEALKETQADLAAQQKMIAEPFAKQAELDRKTARFNEIMDILNPKEEQIIGDEEDAVQYQAREKLDDDDRRKYSKRSVYSETETLFLQWSNGSAPVGEVKRFSRFGKHHFYEKTAEGCVELSRAQYNERIERNAENAYTRVQRQVNGTADKNGYAKGNLLGRVDGNTDTGGAEILSGYTVGEELRNDAGGSISGIDRYGNSVSEGVDKQYQERSSPLTDREVLEMAAEGIEVDSLSEAEKNALDIFNKRLSNLAQLQEERAELGRQYKQQQFTKGGSRQEAERIFNAIQVLDSKIKTAENAAIGLENKDVLKGVLKKARKVVETQEKERGDAMLRRYRERRRESAEALKYRTRIKTEVETLRKWLVSPSSKDIRKHVPAEIQKTVADFLESINLMSKTALRTSGLETTKADNKYLKSMKKMRDAIKANVNAQGLYSGYADLPEGFFEAFDTLISQTEELMSANSGGFVVNMMSAAELKELSKTLRTLKKYITTMNVLHNNAVFRHAGEAAENTIEYLGRLGKSDKSGTAYKFIRFDYMRPSYAFEHFGKGGQSIEHEFREGQATQAKLADKVIDFAKSTYTGEEVRKWSEEIKSFTLSDGEKVSMPVTHLMSLYCLNKRAQALTHIYGDGIRVANFKSGRKTVLDEGHIVSFEDVKKMLKELTPRQREVAEALQRYMSTEAAQWGNYVSMARFDVEQFTEENYFPINSDGRYLSATADESPNNAGLYALLNSSFTKELKENASNRLILYNIFDVFANHTASVAQYRAFALPVLDALKWFNYKNESTSVRTKLSSAFGAPLDERAGSGAKGYAEQFVINLLKAYNGTAPQGDPYDSLPLKMLHRFNGAAIAYNTRVVIQQPTAIARAAMILSPTKLSAGLGQSAAHLKTLAEEMEAHSGIAAWKALGFYDTNISRGLTELIKQNPSTLDRVMDIGTKGAEWADRFTWAAMWYAAKSTVNRSAYDTEEAYFKAVTELFEEVIYKTQVVDSILTKSEFLRAKGGLARQLGSFMSEPSATISMLADAAFKFTDDIQRGMDRSEAWKRNGANIAKTAAVFAVGQVILAAVQAVIDAWRDDDDYSEDWLENFFAKYLKAFKGNAVEELLPFGKIPVVSELYEVMKGWLDYAGVFEKIGLDLYGSDISSGLSMYLKYIDKAAKIIIDKLVGNKTNYTDYGIIFNLIKGASNLTGIPMATAWREVQDIWNNTVGFISPRMKLTTYRSSFDRTYLEYIEPSGLSKSAYQAILERADGVFGNGNGSYAQNEVGAALMSALEDGNITEAQADAIWRSKWHGENSRSFSEWRSKSGKSSSAPAGKAETSEVSPDYDSFKEKVPLYKTAAKEAAYSVWETQLKPAGISLDRFAELLNSADSDGNGSLKQGEMGFALMDAMQSGELSFDQCDAIWRVQWNGAKSKTFAKWLYG